MTGFDVRNTDAGDNAASSGGSAGGSPGAKDNKPVPIDKYSGFFADVILQTSAKVLVFLILAYAIYILFAGHHNPGGGFVGGLVTASGLVLLYLAFDAKTVRQIIPLNFRIVGACGVLVSVLTGAIPALIGDPFLTHEATYATLPVFGETHLATAVLFDIGVFLAVVGTAMTIITSISEDE